jgi:hypothetical protein
LIIARELRLPILRHQLAERGELDRKGNSAFEAQTKALEGGGEHVFGKVRTPSDGTPRFAARKLAAALPSQAEVD